MNLDDHRAFAAVDPADALGAVERTPQQWAQARALAPERLDLDGVRAILVLGMGGSGIAGDLLATVGEARLGLPIVVHKGDGVPEFAGADTLALAVSYSGNTEETLSGFDAAAKRGARLLGVSSGGALAQRCAERGVGWVEVPGGGQPRHSLGWLAVPLLVALGLDDDLDEAIEAQRSVLATCRREVRSDENVAKEIAYRFAASALTVVWGTQGIGALGAYRLACQLNENAKLPVLHAVLPELAHNHIMGFQEDSEPAGIGGLAIVRDPFGESPRTPARLAACVELLGERFVWVEELAPRPGPPLARAASLLLLIDFASVYTALVLDRDPTPVGLIDELKQALRA